MWTERKDWVRGTAPPPYPSLYPPHFFLKIYNFVKESFVKVRFFIFCKNHAVRVLLNNLNSPT